MVQQLAAPVQRTRRSHTDRMPAAARRPKVNRWAAGSPRRAEALGTEIRPKARLSPELRKLAPPHRERVQPALRTDRAARRMELLFALVALALETARVVRPMALPATTVPRRLRTLVSARSKTTIELPVWFDRTAALYLLCAQDRTIPAGGRVRKHSSG
jgi:hypothetical protein